MSQVDQPSIADQITQREQEIKGWRTWATQLKDRGPHGLGVPPAVFDGTVVQMSNIITGKAPPTPPAGYDDKDPNAHLEYLEQQVTLCEQLAQQLRAVGGAGVAGQLAGPNDS